MLRICEIVEQAMAKGCLTLEDEANLRQLLAGKYSTEDFYAFMSLQKAAMAGQVRQESRELMGLNTSYRT